MTDVEFKGVIVPTITPFTPDEEVDVPSLRRHVDYLVSSGVHGIWAAGTTGAAGSTSTGVRSMLPASTGAAPSDAVAAITAKMLDFMTVSFSGSLTLRVMLSRK